MVGLFCGGFKPFTSAHYQIVKRCLKIKDIEKLHIIISNKDRDGITAESSFDFIYSLFKNNKRIEVSISEDASPIKTCYGIVANASKGTFAMISSDKGNDYERVEQFVDAFSEKGKYYNPRVHVINCPIKVDAVTYEDRKDRYNYTAVSASVARNDLKRNNFENFKTNYKQLIEDGIPEKKIKTYFDKLRNEILLDSVSEQAIFRNIQSNDGNVIDYKLLRESFDFDKEPDIDSNIKNTYDKISQVRFEQIIKAYATFPGQSVDMDIFSKPKFHLLNIDTVNGISYISVYNEISIFNFKESDPYLEVIELILSQFKKEISESYKEKTQLEGLFSSFAIKFNKEEPSEEKINEVLDKLKDFWKFLSEKFSINIRTQFQNLVIWDMVNTTKKEFRIKDYLE